MLWRPLRLISVITKKKEKRKLHPRLANMPLLFNENQLYIIQDFAENVCKCKQTVQCEQYLQFATIAEIARMSNTAHFSRGSSHRPVIGCPCKFYLHPPSQFSQFPLKLLQVVEFLRKSSYSQ